MAYRAAVLAPESRTPLHRRGAVGGRFCRSCCSIYPRHAARHVGKPMLGKDHVSAPCSQEGQPFIDGAEWWEPAVALRPGQATGDESAGERPSDDS